MTAPIDPELSMVERANKGYSTLMEVLIRIPFAPYDVSMDMIAKDIFNRDKLWPKVKDMVLRLQLSGYPIRIYEHDFGIKGRDACVYFEDNPHQKNGKTRKEVLVECKAYEAQVYHRHFIPRPKIKRSKTTAKRSWWGDWKVKSKKSVSITNSSKCR